MSSPDRFFNLYSHDFARVAVCVPEVRVADPAFNLSATLGLLDGAARQRAVLAVFPELGLSAYSCEDLFHQRVLLEGCRDALGRLLEASRSVPVIAVVGLPLEVGGSLYNCAVVVHAGRILGVVPKTYLPNYREFYEARHFVPGDWAATDRVALCGQDGIPFGARLLFDVGGRGTFVFHVEICEDLWVPVPPSSFAALAGASVLVNLSASNITVGKDEYRQQLVANQSGRCLAAYVYAAAGYGESTTDLAWDGHGMVAENGAIVARTQRFAYGSQLACADIDLDRLRQDRLRQTTFAQSAARQRETIASFRTVRVDVELPAEAMLPLLRAPARFPYVPSDPALRAARCRDIFEIQTQGLVKRLRAMKVERLVIGVSGGLDSTHALLVCAHAMDRMGLPRSHILAYTLPGFATSERTLEQSRRLMAGIGASAAEVDIRPSCEQMLRDIAHPFAGGEPVHDVTFENVQAGQRTSLLFRLGNHHGAPVVGTSDLSELALGWCTYGVGDHMAHYHVNASVPKTLIQYLIRWVADSGADGPAVSAVLNDVLDTEISPELVPGEENGQPAQRTEDVVGPYALQDFTLYWTLRFGYSPPKIAFLAWCAWRDASLGEWPEVPEADRIEFTIGQIKHWQRVFAQRFFAASQYKRSCIANAPKVGSGGSLSPRGDWRAPSDGEAAAWLAAVERIPDTLPPSDR